MQFKNESSKKIIAAILFVISLLICASGTFFCIYSIVYQISVPVFGARIPGIVFGAVVLGLGVRYIIRLSKLKKKLCKPEWGIHPQ